MRLNCCFAAAHAREADYGGTGVKPRKIAVLWGGGLGDLLVIRPLLQRMNERWGIRPHYLSRQLHFPELFAHFGLDVAVQTLPQRGAALLAAVHRLSGSFDGVYIGGRSTMKTRLLGHALNADQTWDSVHPDRAPFILEQVLADCATLGLGEYPIDDLISDTQRWSDTQTTEIPSGGDYLVLHPSSKAGWETKNWPDSHWRDLLFRLLRESDNALYLIGTESERPRLEKLIGTLPHQERLQLLTSLSIPSLFGMVAASRGVICHNSGLLHVAVQLGKRVLCLNGASADYWRAPYPWVANLESGSCTLRCNRYRCPVPGFDARCIKRLGVEQVMNSAQDFLLLEPD